MSEAASTCSEPAGWSLAMTAAGSGNSRQLALAGTVSARAAGSAGWEVVLGPHDAQ
jgi:hypothetical protein